MSQHVCREAFSLKERLHGLFTWLLHICMPSISLLGKRGGLTKSRPQLLQHSQWESLSCLDWNWEELESLPGEDRFKFWYLFLKDTLGPTSRSICREPERKRFCYPWAVQRSQNLSLADPSQTVLLQNIREGKGKKRKEKKIVMKGGKWTNAKNLHFLKYVIRPRGTKWRRKSISQESPLLSPYHSLFLYRRNQCYQISLTKLAHKKK